MRASSSTPKVTQGRRRKSPGFSQDNIEFQLGFSSTEGADYAHTFISSMDIEVDGALRLDSESSADPRSSTTTHLPAQAVQEQSKRAPRKSKTDALAALNNRSRSSSAEPDGLVEKISHNMKGPIRAPAVLDMTSVKTKSPRSVTKPTPSPFGLEHCPIFYPTMEEFKDPMVYVRSISERAKEYGICKVVPPQGWHMPFVTDTEVDIQTLCLTLY